MIFSNPLKCWFDRNNEDYQRGYQEGFDVAKAECLKEIKVLFKKIDSLKAFREFTGTK